MNFRNLSERPRRDQHPDQAAIDVTALLKVEEKHGGQCADDNEIDQYSPDYAAEGMETMVKRKTIRREEWPHIAHRGNHTHAASSQYCSCLHKPLDKTAPRKPITLPVLFGRGNPTRVGSTITFGFLDHTELGARRLLIYIRA
jgi:hypothetical protein